MSSAGTTVAAAALVGLQAPLGRVPVPTPAPPPASRAAVFGSHYLDKYICPLDQPAGPPFPHHHHHPWRCYHSPDYTAVPLGDDGRVGGKRVAESQEHKHQFQFTALPAPQNRRAKHRAQSPRRFFANRPAVGLQLWVPGAVSDRQLSQSDHIWIQAIARRGNYGGQ